ncbi:hypothetical protein FHX05_005454 [Rhizobium sp. BK491]|nr:hypothetical protein [Rhizobium sp. BK491]
MGRKGAKALPPNHVFSIGTPRPLRLTSLMAGLLARGSQPVRTFPALTPVVFANVLSAYSCGGSHGLGP